MASHARPGPHACIETNGRAAQPPPQPSEPPLPYALDAHGGIKCHSPHAISARAHMQRIQSCCAHAAQRYRSLSDPIWGGWGANGSGLWKIQQHLLFLRHRSSLSTTSSAHRTRLLRAFFSLIESCCGVSFLIVVVMVSITPRCRAPPSGWARGPARAPLDKPEPSPLSRAPRGRAFHDLLRIPKVDEFPGLCMQSAGMQYPSSCPPGVLALPVELWPLQTVARLRL